MRQHHFACALLSAAFALVSCSKQADVNNMAGNNSTASTTPIVQQACPDTLGQASSLSCDCSAEAAASGSLWGSDFYADDSMICRAALHAGVIGPRGGRVDVHEAPGRSSYSGVTRNGVTSDAWPGTQRSIRFGRGDGANEPEAASGIAACPGNVSIQVGPPQTCSCTSDTTGSGLVFGSGPYTHDSAICRAALHAGAVPAGGGNVRFTVGPGRSDYRGSTRHGVESNSWMGQTPASLTFER